MAEKPEEKKNRQLSLKAQKNRFDAAKEIKNTVKFIIEGERAEVASSDPLKPYYVIFSGPKLDCNCTSFIFGNAADAAFECKHIIAARERWQEVTSVGK